ncbi:MAG: glycosyltransferase family 4 protein [Dysgonamonadaceae bacterium]|jgi:glycosyltransferase involved in cell wall biosynthesis|nr:glycosyltransferase family 4 protein [Dysgonamonadaceae bacterium]
MKKVLFINHSRNVAGAETIMLQIINNVFVGGNEKKAFIVEPTGKESSLFKKKLYDLGITQCFSLPYKCWGGSFLRSIIVLFFNLYAVLTLVYRVKKERIDIIYSNTSINCIGIMVAILTRKPHIWHFHETIYGYGWTKYLNILYLIFLRYKKNTVIFISESQKIGWQTKLPKSFSNSKIIYNTIKEINITDNPSHGDVVFGYLGSILKEKNIVLLVNAFHELRYTHSNIKLIIGGTGTDEYKLKELIKRYSLESSIKMIGYVSDVSPFYENIDVFVLPSLIESWGLVALEAMSAGKAVIMTNNSGLHEILGNEECIFFDPMSKQELLDAMKMLMDEKYRKALAIRGYRKVSQYNFNVEFDKSFKILFN